MSGDAWQVLPSVQRNEDGTRPARPPLSDRSAEYRGANICRICCLQRGTGKSSSTYMYLLRPDYRHGHTSVRDNCVRHHVDPTLEYCESLAVYMG